MSLLRGFLNQTCTVFPYLRDGAGEPVYGEPEVRPCRLDAGTELRSDLMGQSGTLLEAPAEARLFLEGPGVPVKSRVTLGGRDYVVLACLEYRAFGRHHVELVLK